MLPALSFRRFQSCFPVLKLLVACWLAVSASSVSGETYRVVKGSHPLDEYAIGALRLALNQLGEGDTVEVREAQLTQTRVIEELLADRVDVMWLASNQEAEDQLTPIRFPLLKGLLGYRINIINPSAQANFDRVDSFEDVRKLKFGQGYGWPDVEILRANGLQVVTTSKYENLFYMVEGGRFHGFPRGVLEPWVELKERNNLGLTVDEEIVLVYRLPFYLFVGPNDQALARKIQRGLDLALENGAFDEYFFNHPMIKSALDKSDLKNRQAFPLENPTLSGDTPLEKQEYWLDLNDL